MGHTMVMGRRTFDSIGRPLPGRRTVVLTRTPTYCPPGVETAPDLQTALRWVLDEDEVFVIGGAQLFQAALPHADRLYLTVVHAEIDGDVLFPLYDTNEWVQVESVEHPIDEHHEHAFTMYRYDRARHAV
jgi:dihydrofolate reductase